MKKAPMMIISFLLTLYCCSQEKLNVKFGKVNHEDFSKTIYSIDSNAAAVVIADVGRSEIVGNSKGWFSLEFKRYKRVHILNKNGYDEGTVQIPLFVDGNAEEELTNVKAYTYNLENGKVVETKMDKGSIFKDKMNKNFTIRKFTLPNIKEGSIIEFEYIIKSDFLSNLQPWEFQGQRPVLWSEYNLRLPEFLGYLFLTQGYLRYDINERKDNRTNFTIRDTRTAGASEMFSFSANVIDYKWVIKNVPALKIERFTSTLNNHITKLEFQLSDYRYPLSPLNVMGTWQKLSNDLMHHEDFGNSLSRNNGWLAEVVNPLLQGTKNDYEKTYRIFNYVRDNFTCTDHSSKWLYQSLKNVLKTRNGNVAEINLLLVAMLKYANVEADPILLSTRDHGYASSIYPILSKFNYVICGASIDGKKYYMDASYPRLGFGRLTPECYNGHARVMDADATSLEFSADSLFERKITSILMNTDDKGNLIGTMQQAPGYYESHDIRERVKEKGKDEFFKEVKKTYGQDAQLLNTQIDSLDKLEEPINIKYEFKLAQDKEDIVYINPMWGEGYKENPFKSTERYYPVEMPYASDETYLFTMIIPNGYVVDELPKSMIVKLNEQGDGQFEYRLSQSEGTISLRSRIILKRAFYLPEEYELLREFFNLIVKKHSEQIVLKKKK